MFDDPDVETEERNEMTNITHGMNIEEVQRLASDLNDLGNRMDEIARRLDRSVDNATWVGPDAATFKNTWWPGHRSKLAKVANDLRGFGQSAKNNADEQQRVSGVQGGTGVGAPNGVTGAAGSPIVTPAGAVDPTPVENWSNGYPGWGQPLDDSTAKSITDKFIPEGERHFYDFDGNPDGAGNWYQCTAWAKARWRQMGYDVDKFGDWRGDGGSVVGNVNKLLGRNSDSHTPTIGALMSRPGHVGVVEQIRTLSDGTVQFKVSEMNMGGGSPAEVNQGRAEEFQISEWTSVGPQHSFAGFPS